MGVPEEDDVLVLEVEEPVDEPEVEVEDVEVDEVEEALEDEALEEVPELELEVEEPVDEPEVEEVELVEVEDVEVDEVELEELVEVVEASAMSRLLPDALVWLAWYSVTRTVLWSWPPESFHSTVTVIVLRGGELSAVTV